MELRRATAADHAAMNAVINAAAQAYRGVIPADRWHEPYMPMDEMLAGIAEGIDFWLAEDGGRIAGVMGIQDKGTVALVRHAYVAPDGQRRGTGTVLLRHIEARADKPVLIGTWAAAHWAIGFYQRNGYRRLPDDEKDRLLRRYWNIPERQVETSVVLADHRWPPAQDWDAAAYARNARFVADLGVPVVDLLAPVAGERILDLGCGDGALTRRLAEAGASVLGVDASADMVAAARAAGLDARVVDGEALDFASEFDAVFSNAALHWMKAPQRVIAGVWRALRPGGRFVGEMGGDGNVAQIVAALEAALAARGLRFDNPWHFPTVEAWRSLLEAQGFAVAHLERIPRPTRLPGDIGGWLETFARPSLAALPEASRAGFIAEMVERLHGPLCDAAGDWHADYVRLRFAAHKPANV